MAKRDSNLNFCKQSMLRSAAFVFVIDPSSVEVMSSAIRQHGISRTVHFAVGRDIFPGANPFTLLSAGHAIIHFP